MKLSLRRTNYRSDAVLGDLSIDCIFECFTLERPSVIIPAGTYNVTLYDSPSHHCLTPLLHDVPNREFIEIHVGNYPMDSMGCILVGKTKGLNYLENSKEAFHALMAKLKEPMTITIS